MPTITKDELNYMSVDQVKDQIAKLDTMSKGELTEIVRALWDLVAEQSATIDRLRDDIDSWENDRGSQFRESR